MATSEELRDRFRELRQSLDAIPTVTEPPKSILRILGSTRAEQQWNRLLAYFLDPIQPHGFGADHLTEFLDTIAVETGTDIEYYHRDIEAVSVTTEVTSPQDNRPDIVVRAPGKWFVCIESKVDATEGHKQTHRYVEDTHIGTEPKESYPDGHHYVFLSKAYAADARADGFVDLYWRHVVEAFREVLRRSHGRYPERSVAQLDDFLSTITRVTNMDDDTFTETQKEKIRLLDEYRDDIDALFAAAETLRKQAIEDWPELFLTELDAALWTDDWHYRYEDYREYGCLFKDGWYLDDAALEPTRDHTETRGSTGFRLHFNHMIRKESSFSEGELTYRLRTPTKVDLRDEFHAVYHSEDWQTELTPLLEERDITNKGNKANYLYKTYDVDQSGLPESYFRTLATAFEEHRPVADVIDDILAEAVENVRDG